MVPLVVDPEGVPTPDPTYTPAPTPTPVSALLLMNFFGTPAFAFRTYRVWKSICFFEHLCLEIACEEIPGPGSYKDKPQIVEGSQCIIYQLHGSKFEQTPGPDDYEDVKEKKEGITIVQFEYYLITLKINYLNIPFLLFS